MHVFHVSITWCEAHQIALSVCYIYSLNIFEFEAETIFIVMMIMIICIEDDLFGIGLC